MGGQDGNRGYLIQSVVALLQSLNSSDWNRVTLEPAHASDKIDICWYGVTVTKACQVKSSINQINLPDAKKWAAELEGQSTADDLTLVLVGPCASSVARMRQHGKVAVPCPKNLDLPSLLGLAAHLLDRFLVREKISVQSPTHRELMVRALVTELSIFASDGAPIDRQDFIELLKTWIKPVEPPAETTWELVDFSHQRGIESAVAGKRLGPADVEQCPEFPICDRVVGELERSHWYSIVGQAGCGKSITAWQAAKKFHDSGYSVWRPHYDANPHELLKDLPTGSLSLLVVDDAQQFGSGFADRLCERSCETLKVIFTSTLTEVLTQNPSCISPTAGVDKLKSALLERKEEILPIVMRFDDQVSNRYMNVSFERRLNDCARQKTPWEFFWVLRGGWRTARAEFESLKQVPNANALLSTIAIKQISGCDCGVSQDQLIRAASDMDMTATDTDRAISHLASLGLILISDEIFRTKHISYAYRIVEESLCSQNQTMWPSVVETIIATSLDNDTSLEGVCWLLGAISMADAARFGHQEELRVIVDPLTTRCRNEWRESEWAVGCASHLFGLFDFAIEEMLTDTELLLEWFTAGTGRIAQFGSNIANRLINASGREAGAGATNVASEVFEQVDSERLVELANGVKLKDFYSFGSLLNRLAFYRPAWSEAFLSDFDWRRASKIILDAPADRAKAVDKFVGSLTLLSSRDAGEHNHKYVEGSVPFVVRATNEDPIHTIDAMHDIFWNCLGFHPKFLRGGRNPDEKQFQIAQNIVAQLDPACFAESMRGIVSRDMETLARSFSVIHEVDPGFVRRVAPLVPEDEFYAATKSDWQAQSEELKHLLAFFCIGSELQPARNWISGNQKLIEGPLEPLLAAIAPQVAIKFHSSGRQVSLTGRGQHRWNETTLAIAGIAMVDKDACIEIVTGKLSDLEAKLYSLTLDPPHYVVRFFRAIHELSSELFTSFVCRLDLDDPRAIETLSRLAKSQPKQRANYEKLARLARRLGGDVGVLGESLLVRLSEESAKPQ